jgi:hypothetical protein
MHRLAFTVFLTLHFVAGLPMLWSQNFPLYEQGKIIVRFKNDIDNASIERFMTEYGLFSYRKLFSEKISSTLNREERVNFSALQSVFEFTFEPEIEAVNLSKLISKNRIVEYSEPSYVYQILDEYVPNDPLLNQQIWLNKIEAKFGWAIHKGSESTVIAIIDAGIHFRHPDLINNVYYNHADPINGIDDDGDGLIDNYHGWDLIGESNLNPLPDNDPQPVEGATTQNIGHGTWVAGIASATPDNAIGIAGTGFSCKFLPIKVSADFDSEGIARIYRSPEAIYIAAEMGASVINCSFGSVVYSQLMQDVIADVTFRKNALVVAAAGNEQADKLFYPAGYDYVLSVAGTDANDAIQTTRNLKVDVSAPGFAITTSGTEGYQSQGVYTSYSAPIVSGIAGIVRSYLPGLNAIQAAERIRTTAKDISSANPDPIFQNKIGRGQANLYRALTINGPAIRCSGFNIKDDNDNPVDPGDNLNLVCTYVNYLSPALNLNVSVSVLDNPYVSVVTGYGTVGLGSINTLAGKTQSVPFKFAVSANAPSDLTVQVRLRYQDGLYDDFEVVTFVINPTYLDIITSNIQTSVGSTGKWGFNNSPLNTQGKGLIYNGRNLLFQGGLILGRSTLQGITVVDNLLETSNSVNNNLQSIHLISGYFPGPKSDKYTVAYYTDNQADSANKINLNIKDETFAFDRTPSDNFILKRLVIRNRNPFLIQNFYAGLFADWDVNPYTDGDNTGFDSDNFAAYVFPNSSDDSIHVAIVPLEHLNKLNVYFAKTSDFDFSDSQKFVALSNESNPALLTGEDIVQTVSSGPLNLLPFDSVVVAFAIVAGNGKADLFENVDLARRKYYCITSGSNITTSFPMQYTACDSIELNAATSGIVRYRWVNPEAESPTLMVNQTGVYSVILTDANECETRRDISVAITNMQPNPVVSRTEVDLSQSDKTVSVSDNTQGAISWRWDFGNGYGSTQSSAVAVYNEPGFYNLSLVVSDGICEKVFQTGITVFGVNERSYPNRGATVIYPNPGSGEFVLKSPFNIKDVVVRNSMGAKIDSVFYFPNTVRINQPNGIYFIEVYSHEHVEHISFILHK